MPGGELDPGLPLAVGEDSDADPGLSGVEHVHRGSHKDGEGAIPPALQEVLRNLRRALEQPMDVQASLEYLRTRRRGKAVTFSMFLDVALKSKQGPATRHVSRTEDVLGILTGMSCRTLQSVFQGLRARRGRAKPCGGAGGRPVGRVVSVDEPEVLEDPSVPGDSLSAELLEDLDVEDAPAEDGTEAASPPSQPDPHDPCTVGLRLGALVARMYVDPRLPVSAYTPMVSFLDALNPGCVGEVNHSWNFLVGLGRCMTQHLQQCIALEHWARVPALNIPSDYARVIDGFTCEGEPCQVIVHIVTSPCGTLEWLLIDIAPNSALAPEIDGADRPVHPHTPQPVCCVTVVFGWLGSHSEQGIAGV